MKLKILFSLLSIVYTFLSFSQDYNQYFDGADTTNQSLQIVLDTSSTNIWQIGSPQKTIFNQAGTAPNVIVTDTINTYPINNTSSFTFGLNHSMYAFTGIMAIQWKQKLDLDENKDGAYIEYSVDTGATWINTFDNPYVYNYYGYDLANKDTLINGDVVFSGVDTNWRDIWLCFDYSWLTLNDSIIFRFSLKSDTIDNQKEGWMIDNMLVHPTWFHTINEKEQNDYIIVFPNPSKGLVNIQAKKMDEFHIIESMTIVDVNGKIIKNYTNVPTKFQIDIRDQPNGLYFLNITTNIKLETFRIVLQSER